MISKRDVPDVSNGTSILSPETQGRILVVDDKRLNRLFMEKIFKEAWI